MTMVLISIAALGVSYALAFGLRHQSDSLWQTKAVALADAYMEEILARRFDETSPLGGVPPCSPATLPCSLPVSFDDGEARAEYDDVDDYDGTDDAPPLDAKGNARPSYERYRVEVAVAYANAAMTSSLGLDDPTDAKLVTITVTAPSGESMRFSGVRGNF